LTRYLSGRERGRTTVQYRILSLDGGGAWALIQVKTLMALFDGDARGHDVLASFDLAAANSGGSLTLAGLAENKRLSEILDMFKDETKRRLIFSPTRSPWRPIYKLVGLGPKYSAAAKLAVIRSLLPTAGNQALPYVVQAIPGASGQPVHLLIVGFDYDTNRATFFRSAEVKDRPVWGSGAPANCTLAEAVHVSTNAPINYFDAPALIPSALDRFWDGGITGCNNPAVAATVEAITQDVAAPDIRLLSIGTGTVFLPFADRPQPPFTAERAKPSFVADLQKLATAILDDPPDIASYIAYALTRDRVSVAAYPDRVVRMNPLIAPRRTADGWGTYADMTKDAFAYLCQVDMDAVAQAQVAAIESYCDLWLADRVPNQPIRMDGATLEPEIGQARFSHAKDAWEKISAEGASGGAR
jgi:hypothetical protein